MVEKKQMDEEVISNQLEELESRLQAIEEKLDEVLEKLDNLGLPGSDYGVID